MLGKVRVSLGSDKPEPTENKDMRKLLYWNFGGAPSQAGSLHVTSAVAAFRLSPAQAAKEAALASARLDLVGQVLRVHLDLPRDIRREPRIKTVRQIHLFVPVKQETLRFMNFMNG